jgi:UDPglucose 6-dehydrogenase
VGLTTGACFAALGHTVVCADIDEDKVARLHAGEIPIVEDGLERLVARTCGPAPVVRGGSGRPPRPSASSPTCACPPPRAIDGSADLSYIEAAAAEIGPCWPESVVVNKSTVPVGSTRVVERALGRSDVFVVSNPEFLREGRRSTTS